MSTYSYMCNFNKLFGGEVAELPNGIKVLPVERTGKKVQHKYLRAHGKTDIIEFHLHGLILGEYKRVWNRKGSSYKIDLDDSLDLDAIFAEIQGRDYGTPDVSEDEDEELWYNEPGYLESTQPYIF